MTSRLPRIYLHIGAPKTGTTYLQDVLWRNQPALATQGVTLPGSGGLLHFHAAMDLRGMRLGGHDDPRISGSWDVLVDKTRQVRAEKVVISHEIFAASLSDSIDRVATDLEGYELHVVLTARDLGRQFPAVWQESLKNKSSRSFPRFLKRSLVGKRAAKRPHIFWNAHDTVAVLERWSAIAPPERVHVVTSPPSGAPSDTLWNRFAAALEIDPSVVDLGVARPNASLTRVDAEVLRRVNAALPEDITWPEYHRLVKRRFNLLANEQVRGERTRIPESFRDAVLEQSQRIIDHIATSGYDVVGDLSDLEVRDDAFTNQKRVSSDEVATAATRLLTAVLMNPSGKSRGGGADAAKPGPTAAPVPQPPKRRRDWFRDRWYAAQRSLRSVVRR
jgi:hypothetical protein